MSRNRLSSSEAAGPKKKQVELTLGLAPDAPRAARRAVDGLTGPFRSGLLDDVRLLVSEVVTNSIKHTKSGPTGSINVLFRVDAGTLRVEVCDSGRGFDPRSLRSPRAESGWGLFIVNEVADRWGVSRGDESCVWFELDDVDASKPGRAEAAPGEAGIATSDGEPDV
jgi:signal transduction histidine kinase